jgi:hypothetical protein
MMRRRSVVVAAIATGLVLVAPAAGAFADYPPPVATKGQGTVEPSRVGIGECTTFSGGGFQDNAHLAMTDNSAQLAPTSADGNGDFQSRVCFNSDAQPGRHVLEASGTGANSGRRTVDATVIVQGASESRSGSSSSGGRVAHPGVASHGSESGGLPFTGFDVLLMISAGLFVAVVGSMLLMVSELRYRRRRRRRASAA